ncbi:MAG TPA: YidC/Oxa1 family membrane protein insertase [Candidatus Paceibacterota bacterium]|nr:YidC/Oxa1 family membrane protein insertase [Candidatus Paceibacterota bacterium]
MNIFETILIAPLYNAFIFLIGIMPGGDVGLAIIAMTIVVRAVFYPAFSASIRTQMAMAAIQGDLDEINRKYKDNPDEKAKHTMELFKTKEVRPFAGFVAILVQIPIFIALYYALIREGLPHVETRLLYSFVHVPVLVNTNFFGLMNLLSPHNILLALIVAGLQYAVVKLSLVRTKRATTTPLAPEKAQAQAMQQNMMLYAMPVLYIFIVYSFPAAAGLYFATSNVISLGQEFLIRRELQRAK